MAYDTIVYEKKGKIAHITLNRPQILNAYNDTMGDELLHAYREFDQDEDLHSAHYFRHRASVLLRGRR